MAQVTWLGEPDGAEACGEFKKGESVEVADNDTRLQKLSKNKFFKVEGWEGPPEENKVPIVPAPSAIPAQHMVPQPGEPVEATVPGTKLKPIPKAAK